MKPTAPNSKILTGQTRDHILFLENSQIGIHREMQGAWEAMRSAAAQAGFDLKICSGFRDFSAQLKIWNGKATGQRRLLDEKGNPLEFEKLKPPEILRAILRWSALPGASRHHWGTDLDVFDGNTLPPKYQIQLIPSEFEGGGIFGLLHAWLDTNMKRFDFFRPYEVDLGGVSPERWHISYAPISNQYLSALSLEVLEETLEASDIELKDEILEGLPDLYKKFVANITPF